MDKKKICALILLGLVAVVLIVNRGLLDKVTIDLVVTSVRASISMILLAATALGVTVGILLK